VERRKVQTSGKSETSMMEVAERDELLRRHAELGVLYETVRDLTSTLSVEQVLSRLLERTLHHLDAEIGSILLLESDSTLRVVSARGLPDRVVEAAEMKIGDGIAGYVAETACSLLVSDLDADPRFAGRNRERYYTNSLISSPLLRMGSVLGVVNVNNKRSRESFVDEDLRLLDAIAGHAAVALGNARQYEETLQRSQRDALTGLANHGHLFASLDAEIERADRYERDLSIAMIDIDHFKRYNDRFGHRSGDAALLQVANTVAAVSRVNDVVARYGGEEFTVVLPETDRVGAAVFGEKIRQSIEAAAFGDGENEALTVSVGIAQLTPENASATALIEAADQQLYRAKFDGRNRVCSV
jgi:diguanylate cyclase (GGDEF)-like protein